MEKLFKILRDKDQLSKTENDFVQKCIKNKDVTKEDIIKDFFDWADSNFVIKKQEKQNFKSHYQLGLTHFQNLYTLINFKN